MLIWCEFLLLLGSTQHFVTYAMSVCGLPSCFWLTQQCLTGAGRCAAMLVLEYMEGGDLAAALQNDSGSGVLAERRLRWYGQGASLARDIAEALVFLHSRKVRPSSADLSCSIVWQRIESPVKLQTVLGVATAM